jgi:hypothetical protein
MATQNSTEKKLYIKAQFTEVETETGSFPASMTKLQDMAKGFKVSSYEVQTKSTPITVDNCTGFAISSTTNDIKSVKLPGGKTLDFVNFATSVLAEAGTIEISSRHEVTVTYMVFK